MSSKDLRTKVAFRSLVESPLNINTGSIWKAERKENSFGCHLLKIRRQKRRCLRAYLHTDHRKSLFLCRTLFRLPQRRLAALEIFEISGAELKTNTASAGNFCLSNDVKISGKHLCLSYLKYKHQSEAKLAGDTSAGDIYDWALR